MKLLNEPLTIEQLKALPVGEWVWLKLKNSQGMYAEKSQSSDGTHFVAYHNEIALFFEYEDYKKSTRCGWTAWKNKEKDTNEYAGKCVKEFVRLPCIHKIETRPTEYEVAYMNEYNRIIVESFSEEEVAKRRLEELEKELPW